MEVCWKPNDIFWPGRAIAVDNSYARLYTSNFYVTETYLGEGGGGGGAVGISGVLNNVCI